MNARDLKRLYRDTVLDHSRNPRNAHALHPATHCATGHNPLCGDRLTLYLDVEANGRIRAAACQATGCAISVASASMLTELVRGKDVAAAQALIADVDAMLAGRGETQRLGELASLSGVRAYPARVRCAALPWRALEAALRGNQTPVTTETET